MEEEGEGVREGEVRVRGGGSGKRETEEMVEEECPTRKGYIYNKLFLTVKTNKMSDRISSIFW